jgi:hypothetical protein
VSPLAGFESYAARGGVIDANCLGGNSKDMPDDRLALFWAGKQGTKEANSAGRFLTSLATACSTVSEALRPGGTAVFVVGRRSTGGFRLKIDEFICDDMASRGFQVTSLRRRSLKGKWAPQHVNRFARASCEIKRASGLLPTMKDEIIVTLEKVAVSSGTDFPKTVQQLALA